MYNSINLVSQKRIANCDLPLLPHFYEGQPELDAIQCKKLLKKCRRSNKAR